MIVPGSVNPLLMSGGDPLDELGAMPYSLRIRSSAGAYLSWTPGSTGNQQKGTFHIPLKKAGALGSTQNTVYSAGPSSTDYFHIAYSNPSFADANDTVKVMAALSNVSIIYLASTLLERDLSQFSFLTVAIDTTQATAANRVRVYLDDVQITAFSTATYPAQNASIPYLQASGVVQKLGIWSGAGAQTFDGYLARPCYVDGQQLTPSAFGKRHPITNQFRPFSKVAV